MIPFVKAHACGNDFLIIAESFAGGKRGEVARKLCDRHTGIGADGVEWLDLAGKNPRAILSNADGSTAEISGNGTRCVAAWLAMEKNAVEFDVETGAGRKHCRILSRTGNLFRVESGMGQPQIGELDAAEDRGITVWMGNPHFVLFVENFPADWVQIGQQLASRPEFTEGTNVEFVRITDTNSIEFRIFERGAGPTLSSGTGTCAAAVAAMAKHGMPKELRVVSMGGEQSVRWAEQLYLTGPAEIIARGEAWF